MKRRNDAQRERSLGEISWRSEPIFQDEERRKCMEKDMSKATRTVPCSVVLLTVGIKEKRDAMTATAMFVAESLPLLAISLAKSSTCNEIIQKTGECGINVASADQVDLARRLGAAHGRQMDKFADLNIPVEEPANIKAPLIKGSFANLECKVITSHQAGNYMVYIVEVVAFKVNEGTVPIAWHGNSYYALEKKIS
jgi:flavin reductase (DIM6/NTAB) family NADH-FMN oxidoreductase RutF